MNVKYLGLGLTAVLLVAVGWCNAQPPVVNKAAAQGGTKSKSGRYQVIGAGLITAVLMDNDTGKTWALTPGSIMGANPAGFGGSSQEFAWIPIPKFDDMTRYREWVWWRNFLRPQQRYAKPRMNNPDTLVKGTVTYNGQRLNGGAIDLNCKPPRGAAINADGTFLMKDVPPGKHKVMFVVAGDPRKIEPQLAVTNKKIQSFATANVEIEVVHKKTNEVIINFK